MNKKVLIIMCGAPGSGKTTYAKNHLNPNDVYISRDEVRIQVAGEVQGQLVKERNVFKRYVQEIQTALNTEGVERVICDATHITQASRDKLCNALNMTNVESILCLVVRPDCKEALRRNEARLTNGGAYVPRSIVRRMYYQFERPEEDTNYPKDVKYVEVPKSWQKFG